MSIHLIQEYLICFSNVKSIKFLTLELVHHVERFTLSKGGDGIHQVGVKVVNDWVEMRIGHVLQRVRLQGRGPFKVVREHVQRFCEDLAEVG